MINTNVKKLGPKKAIEDDFDYKTLVKKTEPVKPWGPKTTEDIFRNKQNIKIIKKLLKDYKNNIKGLKPIIIRGSIGLGKTTLLKLCLSEEGFSCDILNQEFEELSDLIDCCTSRGIEQFFGLTRPKALIIKDFDINLKSFQQQEFFKFLSKCNKLIPIFMTSHNLNMSASKGIQKDIQIIIMDKPFIIDLEKLGLQIIEFNENEITDPDRKVKIKQNLEKYINKLAIQCNGDIKHFEETLLFYKQKIPIKDKDNEDKDEDENENETQELHQLENESIEKIITNSKYKDINYDNVKEVLQKISTKNLSLNHGLRLSSIHTNSVIQENYINLLINNRNRTKVKFDESKDLKDLKDLNDLKDLKDLSKISDILVSSSVIFSYISEYQIWDDIDLLNGYNALGTIYPLTIVRPIDSIKIKKIDSIKYSSSIRHDSNKHYQELEFALKYIVKEKDYNDFIKYLIMNYKESVINMLCRDNSKLKNAYNIKSAELLKSRIEFNLFL